MGRRCSPGAEVPPSVNHEKQKCQGENRGYRHESGPTPGPARGQGSRRERPHRGSRPPRREAVSVSRLRVTRDSDLFLGQRGTGCLGISLERSRGRIEAGLLVAAQALLDVTSYLRGPHGLRTSGLTHFAGSSASVGLSHVGLVARLVEQREVRGHGAQVVVGRDHRLLFGKREWYSPYVAVPGRTLHDDMTGTGPTVQAVDCSRVGASLDRLGALTGQKDGGFPMLKMSKKGNTSFPCRLGLRSLAGGVPVRWNARLKGEPRHLEFSAGVSFNASDRRL